MVRSGWPKRRGEKEAEQRWAGMQEKQQERRRMMKRDVEKIKGNLKKKERYIGRKEMAKRHRDYETTCWWYDGTRLTTLHMSFKFS